MTSAKLSLNTIDMLLAKGLKSEDTGVQQACVKRLFYNEARSLINAIRFDLFKGNMEYDEIVNELYIFLSRNDWHTLNSYRGEARLRTWLSCVAWRYFIRIYLKKEHEIPIDEITTRRNEYVDTITDVEMRMDVETVLAEMPNRRYAKVITLHIIDGLGAEEAAAELETSIANFYNLKLRAIRQFLAIYGRVKSSQADRI